MLDQISESCRFLLQNYPEAISVKDYIDNRINEFSQEKFKFGYFPGIKNIEALSSLVGLNELNNLKLLYTKNIEDSLYPRKVNFCYFEDYPLVMPFRNPYGKVVGIVGRSLLNDEDRKVKGIPKYKNTDLKKSKYLFGLFENKENIIKNDCVYIVEGQFDVIKAVEKGFNNIVAIGSSSLSTYQFSLINRYTNNIFLLLDNDEAGLKGRARIVENFGNLANIRNFYLPLVYKDIDEYLSHTPYDEMELIVKD
jgi:DNA primase catalytic core